jgi:single-strand DNA-binding protein
MFNKVILIGRLTKDPESRKTTNGNINTTFTLAVKRNYKTKEGEQEADYIGCSAWNKLADTISKYCTKGMLVAIEGRLQIRSYDAQDGSKRYATEVLVENIHFLAKSEPKAGDKEQDIVKTNESDPFADFGNEMAISDEDLPF